MLTFSVNVPSVALRSLGDGCSDLSPSATLVTDGLFFKRLAEFVSLG
jgi:hypothetical protein